MFSLLFPISNCNYFWRDGMPRQCVCSWLVRLRGGTAGTPTLDGRGGHGGRDGLESWWWSGRVGSQRGLRLVQQEDLPSFMPSSRWVCIRASRTPEELRRSHSQDAFIMRHSTWMASIGGEAAAVQLHLFVLERAFRRS